MIRTNSSGKPVAGKVLSIKKTRNSHNLFVIKAENVDGEKADHQIHWNSVTTCQKNNQARFRSLMARLPTPMDDYVDFIKFQIRVRTSYSKKN